MGPGNDRRRSKANDGHRQVGPTTKVSGGLKEKGSSLRIERGTPPPPPRGGGVGTRCASGGVSWRASEQDLPSSPVRFREALWHQAVASKAKIEDKWETSSLTPQVPRGLPVNVALTRPAGPAFTRRHAPADWMLPAFAAGTLFTSLPIARTPIRWRI